MKIAYLHNNYGMDGSAFSLISLIRGMVAAGHEAVLISTCLSDIFPEEMRVAMEAIGVRCYCCPIFGDHEPCGFGSVQGLKNYAKAILGITASRYRKSKDRLARVLAAEHADIIHSNTGTIEVGHVLSQEMHVPHVWHLREYQDLDFHGSFYPSKEAFERKLVATEAVVCITRDIARHFHLDGKANAHVVYNGVANESDAVLEFPKEKYFLCASRISEEKGQREVIEAFDRFYKDHADYQLVIAGLGGNTYEAEIRSLTTSLPSSQAIKFIGYQKDVRSLMKKATALVVNSRFEGFGRMTAEAAFYGCLVIGRNTGGTKEILDETGGFLMDGSVDRIHEAMGQVVSLSTEQYAEKAQCAQQKAVQMYSNEQYANEILKVYHSIIG